MEYGLLGPLVVRDVEGGVPIRFSRARERELLAVLLINANRPVAPDRLIQLLWGPDASRSKSRALQQAVHRLRQSLERSRGARDGPQDRRERRLVTIGRSAGYMLIVEPGELDTIEFELQVADALRSDVRPAARSLALRKALELWRGDALADFSYAPFAAHERERLEELKLIAIEERIAADLETGQSGPLVAEIAARVAEHPLRERFWMLLMLALYRSSRQSEALRAYQQARRALGSELGVLPGKELRELEEAILRQDPVLDLETERAVAQPADRRHNLWPPRSPLIGRDEELAEISSQLATTRLVTLTGPIGVGKSRLALHVAMAEVEHCGDGVWMVSAEEAGTEEEFLAAVGETLRLGDEALGPFGRDPMRVIIDSLRRRDLLLWIDGCDNLVAIVRDFAAVLLAACKSVRLLVTSQERLNLEAESHYRVQPLQLPVVGDSAVPSGPTVELFTICAQAADPSFEVNEDNANAVARLLAFLDGLPLAIELAASMMHALTPIDLVEQIVMQDHDLSVSPRSSDRHSSLDAAMELSFARLSAEERHLLLAISVFEGVWTLKDAKAISSGLADADPAWAMQRGLLSTLLSLVDKSLVIPRSNPGDEVARFEVLSTVKRFLRAQLARSGLQEGARRSHAGHFAEFAASRQSNFVGPAGTATLVEFENTRPDLYAALDFLTEEGDERAVALAADLTAFWLRTGRAGDGFRRIQRAVAGRPDLGSEVARAYLAAGVLLTLDQPLPFGNVRYGHPLVTPRYPEAVSSDLVGGVATGLWFAERARGIYEAELREDGSAIAALMCALAMGSSGRHEESIAQAEYSMRTLDDLGRRWWRSVAALIVANGLISRGRYSHGDLEASAALERAEGLAGEALDYFRVRGDAFMTVGALEVLARIATANGRYKRAVDMLQLAIADAAGIEERPGRANLLVELGITQLRAGEVTAALEALSDALAISRRLGYDYGIGMVRCFQGVAICEQGDLETGVETFQTAIGIFDRLGMADRLALAMTMMGYAEVWLGRQAEGQARLLAALDALGDHSDAVIVAGILEGIAYVSMERGDLHRAVQLLAASDAHLDSARMIRIERAEERVRAAYFAATREIGEAAVEEQIRIGRVLDTAAAVRLAKALSH